MKRMSVLLFFLSRLSSSDNYLTTSRFVRINQVDNGRSFEIDSSFFLNKSTERPLKE
ncbi:hypothetical protein BgiBS90_012733, partial [Biomphalaria glabrata]